MKIKSPGLRVSGISCRVGNGCRVRYLAFVEIVVLYRDDSVIAVAKPSGALVHASRYAGPSRESIARDLSRQLGQSVYPVHRLDRGTSGVLLFALDAHAASQLASDFRERRIFKEYLAVVRGFAPLWARIERPLRCEETGEVQDAVTEFSRVACAEFPLPIDHYPATRISLVRVRPLSGRMHQIRRHLRGLGHPILGDSQHGDGPINRFGREHLNAKRLLLHAWRLRVAHPRSAEWLLIEAEPPAELAAIFARAGWTAL